MGLQGQSGWTFEPFAFHVGQSGVLEFGDQLLAGVEVRSGNRMWSKRKRPCSRSSRRAGVSDESAGCPNQADPNATNRGDPGSEDHPTGTRHPDGFGQGRAPLGLRGEVIERSEQQGRVETGVRPGQLPGVADLGVEGADRCRLRDPLRDGVEQADRVPVLGQPGRVDPRAATSAGE